MISVLLIVFAIIILSYLFLFAKTSETIFVLNTLPTNHTSYLLPEYNEWNTHSNHPSNHTSNNPSDHTSNINLASIHTQNEHKEYSVEYTQNNNDWNRIINIIYSIFDEINDSELIYEFCKTQPRAIQFEFISNKIEKLIDKVCCKIKQSHYSPEDFLEDFDEILCHYHMWFDDICSHLFISKYELLLFKKYIDFLNENELIDRKQVLLCAARFIKKII